MSDEEVICTWMEPEYRRMPLDDLNWHGARHVETEGMWAGTYVLFPRELDLDALHEVEARLTVEQWDQYAVAMLDAGMVRNAGVGNRFAYRMLHASAADKIKALATVLRPVVEAAQKEKVSA